MKTLQKRSSIWTAKTATGVSLLAAAMLLGGCSTVSELMGGDKIDYKSNGKAGPSLDVPPDLTQLSRETRYVVPGTTVSANAFQIG